MPEPPYLKTVTVALMGLPQVHAGCTPMLERGINILNLPIISNFVNWAIGAAASMVSSYADNRLCLSTNNFTHHLSTLHPSL